MRVSGLGEMRGMHEDMTSAHTVLLEKHGGKRQLCDVCVGESTMLRQVLKV
jgi:hypothetical protein